MSEQHVFLVIYPTGGLGATFRPDQVSQAHERANQLKGFLVALPVVADYTERSRRQASPSHPVNPPVITAVPEPAEGKILRITSGSGSGTTFERRPHATLPGADRGEVWWSEHHHAWATWTQVQQRVGEADWTIE